MILFRLLSRDVIVGSVFSCLHLEMSSHHLFMSSSFSDYHYFPTGKNYMVPFLLFLYALVYFGLFFKYILDKYFL